MITRVIKRDGREAVFNIEKIANAIQKALDASDEVNPRDPNRSRSQISLNLAGQVADRIDEAGNNRPTIEEIQDFVEHALMENGYPETAKRYIIYRAERTRVREMKTHLMQTFHAMNPLEAGETGAVRNASEILYQYGLTGALSYNMLYLLRPEVSQAHLNRDFYLHDLEYYALTFADFALDLKTLFAGGYISGQAIFREPGDIRTYAALAAIAAANALQETSGCLTLLNVDRVMADGVAKTKAWLTDHDRSMLLDTPALTQEQAQQRARELSDQQTEQATRKAMEAFLLSLNTSVFQLPHHRPCISLQYGLETSPDARLVIRELLSAMERGNGLIQSERTPAHVFLLAKGVNLAPGDPNYDLFQQACACAAVKGQPSFAFSDPTQQSLSTVTLNLPRCAILARNDLNLFYQRLDQQLELAVSALLDRHSTLKSIRRRNFPFIAGQTSGEVQSEFSTTDTLAELIAPYELSVSFVGLAETLVSLVGRHHGQRAEADLLGREIMTRMRETLDEISERHGVKLVLEAGQQAWVARELLLADRTRFGKMAGVTDGQAYTCGFSLPQRLAISTGERLRIEAPFHSRVQRGCVLSLELPEQESDDPATGALLIENYIKKASEAGIHQLAWHKKV